MKRQKKDQRLDGVISMRTDESEPERERDEALMNVKSTSRVRQPTLYVGSIP